jgi:hypothetical protein
MAKVNITNRPFTRELTNLPSGTFEISLDPNGTPIIFEFASETAGYAANENKEFILFGAVNPTNSILLGLATYVRMQVGDTFTILGEVFTCSANPNESGFYPTGAVYVQAEVELSMSSLASAITNNPNIASNYDVSYGNYVGQYGFVLLTAKRGGAYSAFSTTVGVSFNASIAALATYATILLPSVNHLYNTVAKLHDLSTSRAQYLEAFGYGIYIEIWTQDDTLLFTNTTPGIENPENATNVFLARQITPSRLVVLTNPQNKFRFDVSQYLQQLTAIPLPNFDNITTGAGANVLNHQPRATGSYFIRYGEFFNGGYSTVTGLPVDSQFNIQNLNVKTYKIADTQLRWTCEGALRLDVNDPTFYQFWLSQFETGTNTRYRPKALTNQPRIKLKRRREDLATYYPELLYFYFYNKRQVVGETPAIRYTIGVQYVDGTFSALINSPNTIVGGTTNGLYYTNLDLAQLAINTFETGLNRVRYIFVTTQINYNSGGGYPAINWVQYHSYERTAFGYDSNTQVYELDMVTPLARKIMPITWRNPYGCFEMFEFVGQSERTVKRNVTNYEKTLPDAYGYNGRTHVDATAQVLLDYEITVNTGWVNQKHYLWLQELLKSNEVWTHSEWLNKGAIAPLSQGFPVAKQDWQSIKIDKADWKFDPDAKLYNLELTVTISVPDNSIR